MALDVGAQAPNFSTQDDAGNQVELSSFKDKNPVALIFYPKDDTPGWTKQLCSLRDHQAQLDAAGIKAFGISYDDKASHQAFREKYGLSTPLLLDTEKKIGSAYGLSDGEYADRITYVISKEGQVAGVISKIDFDNHATQIMGALE